MPDCIYQERNLFEATAQSHIKTVMVGFRAPRELIRGNVSIDHGENINKYIGSEFSLVFAEWNDIKRLGIENREVGIKRVLANWDEKIRNMIEQSSDSCLFIIVSGEGDVEMASQ